MAITFRKFLLVSPVRAVPILSAEVDICGRMIHPLKSSQGGTPPITTGPSWELGTTCPGWYQRDMSRDFKNREVKSPKLLGNSQILFAKFLVVCLISMFLNYYQLIISQIRAFCFNKNAHTHTNDPFQWQRCYESTPSATEKIHIFQKNRGRDKKNWPRRASRAREKMESTALKNVPKNPKKMVR